MFTGLDPGSINDSTAVGRLIAAGILARGKTGLATRDRWRAGLLNELSARPGGVVRGALQQSIQSSFPTAADREVDVMARIMLYIEAREAGWQHL